MSLILYTMKTQQMDDVSIFHTREDHLVEFLVVQWFRLCAFLAKDQGSIPGWVTSITHEAKEQFFFKRPPAHTLILPATLLPLAIAIKLLIKSSHSWDT